jgi:7-cyano-7-deazaguanine synthase
MQSSPDVRSATGLLVSGGLDSAILLGHLLAGTARVYPLYVDSGMAWQRDELASLRRFLDALGGRYAELQELVVLDVPVADLYGSHWSLTGCDVPDATSPDDAVYLPGRNVLLLVKAALWCQLHGIEELAIGVLQGNPFADATAAFFDQFAAALRTALGRPMRIVRPLADKSKREVLLLGLDLPLEHTFSCIAPQGGLHCGCCNKCAERRAAFRTLAIEDPTPYRVA